MPTTNDLQTDRSVLVNFGLIQVVDELVLSVFWYITGIFLILLGVHGCDWEYGTRIVEQIPDCCIAPVPRLLMGRCGAEIWWAKDNVDFLPILSAGAGPVAGILCAIGFPCGTELLMSNVRRTLPAE